VVRSLLAVSFVSDWSIAFYPIDLQVQWMKGIYPIETRGKFKAMGNEIGAEGFAAMFCQITLGKK
jgi:hypothetical protein